MTSKRLVSSELNLVYKMKNNEIIFLGVLFTLVSSYNDTMRYVGESVHSCVNRPFLEGRNMNATRYSPLLAVNNSQQAIQQEHVYGAS